MPSRNQFELTEVHVCSQPDSEICGFTHSGSKNNRLDHFPFMLCPNGWLRRMAVPKTPDITKYDKESVPSFAATEVESILCQGIAFVVIGCVMALFIMGVPVVTSVPIIP